MNKITYEFTTKRFEYILPKFNITLEFIAERRAEVIACTATLENKVTTLNITTKQGVADFDTANHLVKYYFHAWCLLNLEEDKLRYGKRVDNENYMYKATKEKTR